MTGAVKAFPNNRRTPYLQPVVVGARGDDRRVELAAGVEVVVVGREARLAQLPRLRLLDHAQRTAHLHAHPPGIDKNGRLVLVSAALGVENYPSRLFF